MVKPRDGTLPVGRAEQSETGSVRAQLAAATHAAYELFAPSMMKEQGDGSRNQIEEIFA